MREIIFRGKCPDNGEWHEGLLLTNKIGTYIITEKNPHECHQNGYIEIDEYCRVSPETVGQFTGFKLRSGKYLFDEDILFDEIEEDEGDRRIFYVVTWIKERGAFALLASDEYTEYKENGIDGISRNFEGFYYELDQASILRMHYAGNLHDHPHLLNNANQ